MKTKERMSNFELLRIIAMLMIISFHYVYHGNLQFESFGINKFIAKLFWMFGELGVNLFILITGYFMVKGTFKVQKLLLLVAEVEFYHLITFAAAYKLGLVAFPQGIKQIIITFTPLLTSKYWFITVYIMIYLLSPYINKFINSLSQREFIKLLTLLLVLWSVIPTFYGVFYNSTESMLYYNRFLWLLIMYIIGAYIRIYGIPDFITKKLAIISMTLLGVIAFSIIIIEKNSVALAEIGLTESAYFWRPNSLPLLLLSVSIFGIFMNLKVPYLKVVNRLASTTLGVYILHDGFFRNYLWTEVFKNATHIVSRYFILHILSAALVVFLVGAVVDMVRQGIENVVLKGL